MLAERDEILSRLFQDESVILDLFERERECNVLGMLSGKIKVLFGIFLLVALIKLNARKICIYDNNFFFFKLN